jgi:3-deoxy-7-phosphoheptulonate synthase
MIYIHEDENINFPENQKIGVYYVLDDSFEDQLSSEIKYKKVSDKIKYPIGYKSGEQNNVDFCGVDLRSEFLLIAGPCSAESEEQVEKTVEHVSSLGLKFFRAGCYKPRTNPYSFQGLGREGLKLCRNACDEKNLKFISEVKDLSNLDDVMEFADVIQVGSKAMYDVGVLREIGKTNKPVLLKRHFGATLVEFAQHADFIASYGNTNIALCERGIRTFESSTRFSLDSSGIEWLKKYVDWPIIGDPSHAMGYSYGVEGLSLGMIAQRVNGLLIEVHPDPSVAKSDASQQLNFEEFKKLHDKILKLSGFMNEL